MNTYRERLQALIEQLQACYDETELLRDYSDSNGQKLINASRRLISGTWGPLQSLDNSLSDGHASMITRGKGFCK